MGPCAVIFFFFFFKENESRVSVFIRSPQQEQKDDTRRGSVYRHDEGEPCAHIVQLLVAKYFLEYNVIEIGKRKFMVPDRRTQRSR